MYVMERIGGFTIGVTNPLLILLVGRIRFRHAFNIRYDQATGGWIFIAIISTRLDPAGGGTRMKPYHDVQSALQDAHRLAER